MQCPPPSPSSQTHSSTPSLPNHSLFSLRQVDILDGDGDSSGPASRGVWELRYSANRPQSGFSLESGSTSKEDEAGPLPGPTLRGLWVLRKGERSETTHRTDVPQGTQKPWLGLSVNLAPKGQHRSSCASSSPRCSCHPELDSCLHADHRHVTCYPCQLPRAGRVRGRGMSRCSLGDRWGNPLLTQA